MNLSARLQNIDQAFGNISVFPVYKHLPLVIGEQDPDGCAACLTPAYDYRNGIFYPSFVISSFIRAMDLSRKWDVNLQGSLTWAFGFECPGFEWFDGFRVLSTNGITKPVLNAQRMLAKMSGTRLKATSSGRHALDTVVNESVRGSTSDVGVLATCNANVPELAVLGYNYHDDEVPRPSADVSLQITQIPWPDSEASLARYRIDHDHSNAYNPWLAMGGPQNPTQREYAMLRDAAEFGHDGTTETHHCEQVCERGLSAAYPRDEFDHAEEVEQVVQSQTSDTKSPPGLEPQDLLSAVC